jgi:hypothetical protein
MISAAATIVESGSVRGGSEFDQRRRVKQWDPKLPIFERNQPQVTTTKDDSPVIYDKNRNITSLSDTSTITSSQFIHQLVDSSSGDIIDISLKDLEPFKDPDSDLEYEVIQHWLRLATINSRPGNMQMQSRSSRKFWWNRRGYMAGNQQDLSLRNS